MNAIIQQVMQKFDFETVHKAMIAVDWRWDNKIPDLIDLQIKARSLLTEAYETRWGVGSGGFYARCDDGIICLEFTLEYVNLDLNTLEEV